MTIVKRGIPFLGVFGLALWLAGCGGGGGGDPLPAERPASTVSGNAVDALIRGGDVNVYALSESAVKGAWLGAGKTDADGFYEISIQAPSLPVLIEVTGGVYTEESSGRNVSLGEGDVLRAMTFYQSGQPLNVMVTPFTNLASGLVEFKVRNGTNLNNAITEAATSISTIAGLDILTTVPRDVTNPINHGYGLDDGMRYGLLTAGISMWTEQASLANNQPVHSLYTSVRLAKIMYNDIRADGQLDGFGYINNSGTKITALGFGLVPLDANIYRTAFAQNMLAFLNNENNATTITVTDLLADSQDLSSSTHAVFGSLPPVPLDEEGPVISTIDPAGTFYNGSINYRVDVSDFTSVETVEFSVDGISMHFAADPNMPGFPVNTAAFSDGEHAIGVRAMDVMGNISTTSINVNFFNSGPTANLLSPAITNKSTYQLEGTYLTNGSGIALMTVQSKNAQVNDDGTWTSTVSLVMGQNTIPVEIVDGLGNTTQQELLINVDVTAPVMSFSIPNDKYLVDYALTDGTVFKDIWTKRATDFPLYRPAENLSLNGLLINGTNLQNNGYPYYFFTVTDVSTPANGGVFSQPRDIVVTMTYERDGETLIDNRTLPLPQNGEFQDHLIPIATEFLGDDWYEVGPDVVHTITLTATDEAGNTRTEELLFKVLVLTPQVTVNTSDIQQTPFDTTTFEKRASLDNTTTDVFQYIFTNELDKRIFMSVQGVGNTTVSNTVETAIRENRARLRTSEEWRAKFFHASLQRMDVNNQLVCVSEIDSDWRAITGVQMGTGASSGSNLVTVNAPADIVGNYNDYMTDSPTPPTGQDWATFHIRTPPDTYSGDYVPKPSDAIPFPALPQYGQILLTYSYAWMRTGCNDNPGPHHGLQKRIVNSYESEPGYPRNVFDTFTLSESSGTQGIRVEVLGRDEIIPIGGYYRVNPGETVVITKSVTTPSVTHYNDNIVADRGSFTSYTEQKFDQRLQWDLDRGLEIATLLDIGFDKINSQTPSKTVMPSSIKQVTLSR